jgi:hypothetical protein
MYFWPNSNPPVLAVVLSLNILFQRLWSEWSVRKEAIAKKRSAALTCATDVQTNDLHIHDRP